MYKHMVLWKLKSEVDGVGKRDLALEVKRRLDALPSIISEIDQYEVGINIGSYGASFFDVLGIIGIIIPLFFIIGSIGL